jgi:hypothetical protein
MATPVLTKEQIEKMLMPTFTSAEQAVYFQEMQRLISIIEKTDKSIQLYKITHECGDNDPYIVSKLDLREEFVNKLAMLLSNFNIHFQPIPNNKNELYNARYVEQPLKISQAA